MHADMELPEQAWLFDLLVVWCWYTARPFESVRQRANAQHRSQHVLYRRAAFL